MRSWSILTATLATLPAIAGRAEPQLDISLKAGANAATLNEQSRFNRYGFSGGVASQVRWRAAEQLSFAGQLELLYTPRGADVVFDGEPAGRSRGHYIDIAIAFRPELRLGPARVYALVGGGLDVLLRANIENAAGAAEDITDDLHRIDVALLGGLGVAVPLFPGTVGPAHIDTVFVEVRHDIGLLDTDAVNGGFKNRTSSLMLGLSFGVRRPPPAAATTASSE